MSASTERKNRIAAKEAGTDKKTLAQLEEAEKRAKSKRKWTFGTIAVLVLIAVIILLDSSFLYRATTAVTIGDEKYSPAEVDYYYVQQFYNFYETYGSYASYIGLDLTYGLSDLKNQDCTFTEEGSWRDYFLDAAYTRMQTVQACVEYANENGITLDEEELAEIDADLATLKDTAKEYGYSSANKYLAANYGEGVNTKTIRKVTIDETLAAKASSAYVDSIEYTDEQLAEEYATLADTYDVIEYISYFVEAESVESADTDGNTSSAPTEETLAAAKATAGSIYSAYRKSDKKITVERFNEAVKSAVADAETVESTEASAANLGEFAEWVGSDARVDGDVYMFENSSETGYYVVAFISRDRNDYAMKQVRHILIKAVASDDGTYTDEAKAEALAKAEEILAEFNAGDKTEDSFAALAVEYSEDTGSAADGGLMETVAKGVTVEEFDAFCFADHQYGDTAIVYGESGSYAGYHVMFYIGDGRRYCDYIAEYNLSAEDANEWLEGLMADLTVTEGYGKRFVG